MKKIIKIVQGTSMDLEMRIQAEIERMDNEDYSLIDQQPLNLPSVSSKVGVMLTFVKVENEEVEE